MRLLSIPPALLVMLALSSLAMARAQGCTLWADEDGIGGVTGQPQETGGDGALSYEEFCDAYAEESCIWIIDDCEALDFMSQTDCERMLLQQLQADDCEQYDAAAARACLDAILTAECNDDGLFGEPTPPPDAPHPCRK